MIACRFAPIALVGLVVGASDASADSRFALTRELTVDRTFSIAACGDTPQVRVSAPRGAARVRLIEPEIGHRIASADTGDDFAFVSDAALDRASGRVVARVTALGSDAACRAATPNCDTQCPVAGESDPVSIALRYSRRERVYVTGTGRGGSRSYKPPNLPFGLRSTIVRLRWRNWGSPLAVGRGDVEYNPCIPNCASGRPVYYPVRATLSRRRLCNGYAQYLTLRFTYRTAARPAGVPDHFVEQLGGGCAER